MLQSDLKSQVLPMNDQIQEIIRLSDYAIRKKCSGIMVPAEPLAYLLSEVKRLQTECKELEGVLKWYADKDNYDPRHLDTFGYIPIDKDEGKRAADVLSHLKG
ncbi:hypothetical protein D3C76_191150 [compost metagenome]